MPRPTSLGVFRLLFVSLTVVSAQESTLKFVQIWFRHGERLPTNFLQIPGEPIKPFDYGDVGYAGELTKRGLNQEYELGQMMRQYYGSHFGDYYRPPEIFVYTGSDNRTSTSAQAFFAGFLPPNQAQTWIDTLKWQPVAQHTDAALDWVSTGVISDCENYGKEFASSNEYSETLAKVEQAFPELVQVARRQTGLPLNTPLLLNRLLDSINVRRILNDERLPVPAWAAPHLNEIGDAIFMIHDNLLSYQNATIGRYHNEIVTSVMEDHVMRTQFKGVFFSAHDTNLLLLWKSLSLSTYPSLMPGFGSHLAIELHSFGSDHVVKFWASLGVHENRFEVSSLACGSPCLFSTFKQMVKDLRKTRSQWYSECSELPAYQQTSAYLIPLIVALVALLISTIALGYSTYSYRRQLHQNNYGEQSPLLG